MNLIENAYNQLETEESLSRLWKLFLRVCAIGLPIILFIISYDMWSELDEVFLPVKSTLALAALQLILILMGAWSFAILWTRSNSQLAQPSGKRFPLLELAIPGCKAMGELFAGWFALMGLGAALSIWIAELSPPILKKFVFGASISDSSFVSGLATFVFGILAALVCIQISYLVAEGISVILSIERNTKD